MSDKKRRPTIAELEAVLSDPHSPEIEIRPDGELIIKDSCSKRIRELEAQLAAAEARVQNLSEIVQSDEQLIQDQQSEIAIFAARVKELESERDFLKAEESKLEAAEACLREIEDHPYRFEQNIPMPDKVDMTDMLWRSGMKDGHNNCAAIVRKWREPKV